MANEHPAGGEHAVFWRDRDLGNLELLHANYIRHRFVPHIHDGFAIGVIEAGAEQFDYRHARHVAPMGSVVVINPGEPHTGSAATDGGWRYRMLYPASELLQDAASQLADRPHGIPFFPEPVIDDATLAHEIAQLHRALERSDDRLERESRLLLAFGRLVQRHAEACPIILPTPTHDDQAIQRVRSLLHDRYNERVTLAELAEGAGFSPFHLLRLFHARVGLPPHAYLTQVRVHRAKELLAHGLAVAKVAALVGFTDQSHLTRHFKRIVGVPPGVYRAARA